jgi:hypothetical protein
MQPTSALLEQLSRHEGSNYTEYYSAASDGTIHGHATIKTNHTDLRAAEREYHYGRLVWMKLYDPPTQELLRTMYYDEDLNPHGTWHQYDAAGTMLEEVTYNHGAKDGIESQYHSNGILRFRAEYKNGYMHGKRTILISGGFGSAPPIYDNLWFEEGRSVSRLSSQLTANQLPSRLEIPPRSRGDEEA